MKNKILVDSNIIIYATQPYYSKLLKFIEIAITLRQRRKRSLGDSIIGATALSNDLSLATHNIKDFKWIDELELIDPLL